MDRMDLCCIRAFESLERPITVKLRVISLAAPVFCVEAVNQTRLIFTALSASVFTGRSRLRYKKASVNPGPELHAHLY